MKTLTPMFLIGALLCAPVVAEAKRIRGKRLSSGQVLALIRATLAGKASLASVARRIDRRLRRAEALPFVKEPTDELHPALSTPWDLPRAEYPNRAVLKFPVKVFGKHAELRLVAPLALLSDKSRTTAATAKDRSVVLMLTALGRGKELPLKAVERLIKRIGCSVYSSGELGNCKPDSQWCYTRQYAVVPRGKSREGVLMLELGGGGVGGLKLIAKPR